MTHRRTLTALTAAAATCAPTPALALSLPWAVPGPAIQLTATCPGVDMTRPDDTPTPTCPMATGRPLTVENRAPAVIEHHPAYGWYPPTCIIAGHRWDSFGSPFGPGGGINAGARIVRDDHGTCSGPTVPMDITISATPAFANIYGIGGPYPAGRCWPAASSTTGIATVARLGAGCAAPNYGDWERGYYSVELAIITAHGAWTLRSTHQIA